MSKLLGPAFREVRQIRGMSIKDTAQGICTTRFLHKFENGESDIRSKTFVKLLNRLFINFVDISMFYKGPFIDEYNKTSTRVEKACQEGNTTLLLSIIEKLKASNPDSPSLPFSSLVLKSEAIMAKLPFSLEPGDKERVLKILSKTKRWGELEFIYLHNFFDIFPDDFLLEHYPKALNPLSLDIPEILENTIYPAEYRRLYPSEFKLIQRFLHLVLHRTEDKNHRIQEALEKCLYALGKEDDLDKLELLRYRFYHIIYRHLYFKTSLDDAYAIKNLIIKLDYYHKIVAEMESILKLAQDFHS